MRSLTMSLVATLSAALCGSANAHEFWIQPESYTVTSGEVLRLSLMHGERFLGDPVTRNNGYIQRFECVGAEGASDVRGLDGHATSFARPSGSAHQILVYHSQEYTNLLEADRFNAYLREEGLGGIIERRAARGESDEPGREVYSRCAKSLISIGDDADAADREIGLPYELVLGSVDEAGDGAGDGAGVIRARVLLRGEPAPGVRVIAVSQAQPSALHEATSDDTGAVEFEGAEGGAWMLTSLYMERLEGRADADWQSYWASLTFQIGQPTESGSPTE